MKLSKLSLVASVGLVSASMGVTAFADHSLNARDIGSGPEYTQASGFVGASSTRSDNGLGSMAPAGSATRQIVIDGKKKYVNVTRGETVTFVAGGKSFAWNFNTLGTTVLNLDQIAPKDVPVGSVRVYVAPSVNETSGG